MTQCVSQVLHDKPEDLDVPVPRAETLGVWLWPRDGSKSQPAINHLWKAENLRAETARCLCGSLRDRDRRTLIRTDGGLCEKCVFIASMTRPLRRRRAEFGESARD